MKPCKYSLNYRIVRGVLKVRVRWNTDEVNGSTGLHVSEKGWIGRQCRPGSCHGPLMIPAEYINTIIAQLEQQIATLFLTASLEDRIPSRSEVTQIIKPQKQTDEKQNDTFADTFNHYVASEGRSRTWTYNTTRSVMQLGRLVTSYAPRLTMADITPRWLDDFTAWQQTHRLHRGRTASVDSSAGYTNEVILKNCRILRAFLRWAADAGRFDGDTLRQWRPRLRTVPLPVIYLTADELARFESTPCAAGSPMERARDLFSFAASTGLRYSDIMALRKSDIHPDCITLTTRKTATPLTIELNTHSRRVLERYASPEGEGALPHMDAAQLNLYIKKVAQAAGIDTPVSITRYYGGERRTVTEPKWRLLSSHAGRRTFVCRALALGIPPAVVMKWTGHSDYAAMRPYIDIADETRRAAMKLFDD